MLQPGFRDASRQKSNVAPTRPVEGLLVERLAKESAPHSLACTPVGTSGRSPSLHCSGLHASGDSRRKSVPLWPARQWELLFLLQCLPRDFLLFPGQVYT